MVEEAFRVDDPDPDLVVIGSCDGLFVIRHDEVGDYLNGVAIGLLSAALVLAFVSATWLAL